MSPVTYGRGIFQAVPCIGKAAEKSVIVPCVVRITGLVANENIVIAGGIGLPGVITQGTIIGAFGVVLAGAPPDKGVAGTRSRGRARERADQGVVASGGSYPGMIPDIGSPVICSVAMPASYPMKTCSFPVVLA